VISTPLLLLRLWLFSNHRSTQSKQTCVLQLESLSREVWQICDLMAFLFSYVMSGGKVWFPIGRHILLLQDCSRYWTKDLRLPLWLGEPKSSGATFWQSWTCYMQVSDSAGSAAWIWEDFN
jgi:hypothetical protein